METPTQSSEFICFHDQTTVLIVLLLKAYHLNMVVSCFVSRLTVKAVAVLLPILGISWIFGVLAVNTHSLPFLYIFAVLNSLQVSSHYGTFSFPKCLQPFVKVMLKLNFFPFSLGVLCLLVSLSSQL